MIKLELPELKYSMDSLAPYMSAETLELHHDKHHLAYVTNGNKFIQEQNILEENISDLVISAYKNSNAPVFNNISQHINHNHFWEILKNNPNGNIPSELENKINEDFTSLDEMKNKFINAGISQFGSGWCWLVLDENKKLIITKTPDVWEHSYYVDFKNRRPDYIKSFLDNLINWERVNEIYLNNI